ncbi:hypothetical protein [Streptomyces nigrescens]|uniref:hypothetical protein n=1 Tax=Streptomyces nigrescens TaxID=1920 RepID=UPI0036FCE858
METALMLAVLDLVFTIFLPLVMGASITYESSADGVLTRPSDLPGLVRGEFRPLRALLLLLPLVWQPVVGSQFLVERSFGVLSIIGIGMLFGMFVRLAVEKVRRIRRLRARRIGSSVVGPSGTASGSVLR